MYAEGSSQGGNQIVSAEECNKIRALSDFDLVMLISDIHDHGWAMGRRTLEQMPVRMLEDLESGA